MSDAPSAISSRSIQAPDLDDIGRRGHEEPIRQGIGNQDKQGTWYRLQVRPYRTTDNRIDGAVITLTDITVLKRAEESCKSLTMMPGKSSRRCRLLYW